MNVENKFGGRIEFPDGKWVEVACNDRALAQVIFLRVAKDVTEQEQEAVKLYEQP